VWSVELLGSWASGDSTLLWACANDESGLPGHVLSQSRAALALGVAAGDPLLTEPMQAMAEDDAFRLCLALSGTLPNVRALYPGAARRRTVFLAITDLAADLPARRQCERPGCSAMR